MVLIPCSFDILPLATSERIHSDAKEHADFILKMHEITKHNIEKMTEKYRVAGSKSKREVKLEQGDLVWLHLRKNRFTDLRMSKLMPRADGSFKIVEKINNNAYKFELSPEFGVIPIFNISDLRLYLGKKMRLSQGRLQFKTGRMMRTSLLRMHTTLRWTFKVQSLELARGN
jgi:hypothetical protein